MRLQLVGWNHARFPVKVKLGYFLDHAEAVATPMVAAVDGLLAVQLSVGLPVLTGRAAARE